MRQFNRKLIVLSCLALSFAPSAQAGFFDRILSRCAALIEGPYKKLLESNKNQVLILTDKDTTDLNGTHPWVALDLGKQLGAGFFGQVMILNEVISTNGLEKKLRNYNGSYFDGKLVSKIPHAFREIHMGRPIYVANKQSIAEYENYQLLKINLPAIELDSHYPLDASFEKGVMPVAPILGVIRTERGWILVKPLLEGLFLSDIKEIYIQNGNALPEDMIQGLKDHYQFIQAVYNVVKPPKEYLFGLIKSKKPGDKGYSTDIRPPNFMWLKGETEKEKAQLKFLGYKRPGFITFEMAMMPLNKAHYIEGPGLSQDEFISEFINDYVVKAED